MRSLYLSIIVALTYAVVHSLAIPLTTDTAVSLAPRAQHCQNSPNTIAGTPFNVRRLSPSSDLAPRYLTNTITWCTPGTRTYVVISMLHDIPGRSATNMLAGALQLVVDTIEIFGDDLIEPQTGRHLFRWMQGGVALTVENANNHQTTWGFLKAAIAAVRGCMVSRAIEDAASFRIVDGRNVVGRGTIE